MELSIVLGYLFLQAGRVKRVGHLLRDLASGSSFSSSYVSNSRQNLFEDFVSPCPLILGDKPKDLKGPFYHEHLLDLGIQREKIAPWWSSGKDCWLSSNI